MRQGFTTPPGGNGNGGASKEDSYERTFAEVTEEMAKAAQIPPPPPEMFYGPLGQIALAIGKVTEFDPAGTYASLLCCVGNALSRAAIFRMGSHIFPPIDNVALVGETSDARKSTTMAHAVDTVVHLDPSWYDRTRPDAATGEWIVEQIHDPQTKSVFLKREKKWEEQPSHPGIDDKRLLINYDEMLVMITKGKREGCSLIPTIRQAWDCRKLQPGSKNTAAKVNHPRVSILAGTTPTDLRKHFPPEWLEDGTANRFLWILIRVMPPQPDGGPTAVEHCPDQIKQLQEVFDRFSGQVTPIQMQCTQAFIDRWREIYVNLKKRGAYKISHRTEAHVLRAAETLALCDNHTEMDLPHLNAAVAYCNYSSECARAIFYPQKISEEAQQIIEFLRDRGAAGATRSEIFRRVFQGHVKAKDLINCLKETLQEGYTRCEGKRPEHWYALDIVGWGPDQEPPTEPNATETETPSHAAT